MIGRVVACGRCVLIGLLGAAQSFCDPRLNFEQSLGTLLGFLSFLFFDGLWGFALMLMVCVCEDVAFLISNHFKKERAGVKTGDPDDVLYTELSGRFAAAKKV